MKTAISLPDAPFDRVERAARRLGVSRSELFARAAESWLDALEGDATTEAINQALAHASPDQIATLDRGALEERIGALPDWLMSQVENGLGAALALIRH